MLYSYTSVVKQKANETTSHDIEQIMIVGVLSRRFEALAR